MYITLVMSITRSLGYVHRIFLKGRFGKFICSCYSGKMDGQLTFQLGLAEGIVDETRRLFWD